MSDTIDLDALAPEPVTIKLHNEEIKIEPPSLEDVMRLGGLADKLQKADPDNIEGAADAIKAVTDQLVKCAPGLEGKSLNPQQMMSIVDILMKMVTPPDAKQLKERGITPAGGDGTEKKDPTDTPTQ